MPQPYISSVHVNQPLTNFSLAVWQSQGYAWNSTRPVRLTHRSDVYRTYDQDFWFRTEAQRRAPGTESVGSGYAVTTATVTTDRWAIHHDIDDPTRRNADADLNLDREAAEWTAMQLNIRLEALWAAVNFVTGVWNASTTPGVLWDVATSDPISDMEARALVMQENTGRRPNTLYLGAQTYSDGLKNNPDLLDRIKFSERGIVTTDLIAAAMDLDRVVVCGATRNTALEGVTRSMDFVAGQTNALLAYVSPTQGLMTPTAFQTFVWPEAGAGNEFGVATKKYRLPESVESDRVETEIWVQFVLTSSLLGEAFISAVS